MISGTYILTDTIDKAFDLIFSESYAGTDAVITGRSADISFEGETATAPPVYASLLPRVRRLSEVDAAAGSVVNGETDAKILTKSGEVVETEGAPSFGFGVDFAFPRFNPLRLVDGRWPQNGSEVVIDSGTAGDQGYHVGDTVRIGTLAPARAAVRARRRGPVREVSSLGSDHLRGVHDPGGAAAVRSAKGQFDAISAPRSPRVTQYELDAVDPPIFRPDAKVQSGRAAGPGGERRRRTSSRRSSATSCSRSPGSRCSSARS